MSSSPELAILEKDNAELRERLAEAESILRAIRHGEIDAVVVSGPDGEQVFTLEGADHPYRLLVESMNEGAATLAPDGFVLYANRRLAALLGLPATRLLGTGFAEFVAPGAEERLAGLLRDCTRGSASGELELMTGAGAKLPVRISLSSFLLDGEPFCCAVITDLRLAEHYAALEKAAQQIREANEKLREADQRKDEFLATLAHELRNPLAPIRAAAHAIKLVDHDDPRLTQARDMIDRQVVHMARLIDDLLELSRVTLGKINLQRRGESVTSLLASVADAVRMTLKADQVFDLELPREALWVDADATRLSQAISNVLENAVKYTPPGGRISMAASRRGDCALIRIRDTGVGIAPDMLPRIFDMFVQIESDARGEHHGLGIGLALARRLIAMHGGEIEASSAGPGRGTEFAIRLPLAVPEHPRAEAQIAEGTPVGLPRSVLIVDDNRDVAEGLKLALEMSGHHVQIAHGGAAALDVLGEMEAEIMLLDIGLPDIDGYEVARRARARYGGRCPTLVALSGWGQDEDKKRAAEAGIDFYFTKPVDPAALSRLFMECRDRT